MKKKSKFVPIFIHTIIFLVAIYFFAVGIISMTSCACTDFCDCITEDPSTIMFLLAIILFLGNLLYIFVHVVFNIFRKKKLLNKKEAEINNPPDQLNKK